LPDAWVDNVLSLYDTCAHRNALPEKGGVMDQPAEMMRWFKIIDAVIDKHKQEKEEREKAKWLTSKQS
jgi:hypothetical protein